VLNDGLGSPSEPAALTGQVKNCRIVASNKPFETGNARPTASKTNGLARFVRWEARKANCINRGSTNCKGN